MSDNDDLLALLSQVQAGGVPVTATSANPPAKPAAVENPEPEQDVLEIPSEPTPVETPESAIYDQLTLTGLRKYRPDLVQAIEKSGDRVVAGTVKVTPGGLVATPTPPQKAQKGSALEDYQAYRQISMGMLQTDPATVSGRRLANLRTKYMTALVVAGIQIPAGSDVTFVINGASIDAVWSGVQPTLPEELQA